MKLITTPLAFVLDMVNIKILTFATCLASMVVSLFYLPFQSRSPFASHYTTPLVLECTQSKPHYITNVSKTHVVDYIFIIIHRLSPYQLNVLC
jgi:hypothetical protein